MANYGHAVGRTAWRRRQSYSKGSGPRKCPLRGWRLRVVEMGGPGILRGSIPPRRRAARRFRSPSRCEADHVQGQARALPSHGLAHGAHRVRGRGLRRGQLTSSRTSRRAHSHRPSGRGCASTPGRNDRVDQPGDAHAQAGYRSCRMGRDGFRGEALMPEAAGGIGFRGAQAATDRDCFLTWW